MEYNFTVIEPKWQIEWKAKEAYKVSNISTKPSFYVLDMFPYPSGAGLHVGHPLGYIASDIFSRYKRLKGFNVLHPMGFDSFGLPAEQYALETGQHPAVTTEKNIETFKAQLDKIGFCYDWSREVRTSDPSYYKWTQKIFLDLFNSYYCKTQHKARPITELIEKFSKNGNSNFTAEQWNGFSKNEQEDILMQSRLAFSAYGEVNWCEGLGTVLANDEVVNGVSERGGHPVIKKKMRQWYLRITAYADRLLHGLDKVEFSDAMKEMQRNWIGKSEGAEINFPLNPGPSPRREKGDGETDLEINNIEKVGAALAPKYKVTSPLHFELARKNRKEYTEAENVLWQAIRASQLGAKFRRQHPIDAYIVDFVSLQDALIIEADGGYHENETQKEYDNNRTRILEEIGFKVIRFTNDEILGNLPIVLGTIKGNIEAIRSQRINEMAKGLEFSPPSPPREEGMGLRCYTTRPETIFGVDFLVLAPEHALVAEITTAEQKTEINNYLTYVKSRSDRERQAEVKLITGCFTGAYANNPFSEKPIPVWIAEYVLAGYGTGAIMAVPCGDQRDFAFANHFNIPITNIIGSHFNGHEANATKDATLQNSDFLNGMVMKDAIPVAIHKIEELGIGKRKVNYRMRDAGFSRQRYWGEPFPIIWEDGIAVPLNETDLPVELPHAEKYGPGPEGEGPLANLEDWIHVGVSLNTELDLTPNPSPKERGVEHSSTHGYITSTPTEWKNTIGFAKENRKEATVEEDIMWQSLRGRQIDGSKFRRQHPIAGYIPDFVCLEKKLIIEIDGGYHNDTEQKIFDEAREKWLKEYGYTMLRFTNEKINGSLPTVLEKIKQTLQEIKEDLSLVPPLPLRGDGGEVSLAPIKGSDGSVISARRESSTMPGYAGSSWYFLRYMDPNNTQTFCDRKASDYWGQVDVYIGGTEHAVGHLLYSRMWTKVLYDLGYIGFDEPFKKLVNQGMIQGSSRLFNWLSFENATLMGAGSKIPSIKISKKWAKENYENLKKKLLPLLTEYKFEDNPFSINKTHIYVGLVDGTHLNLNEFKKDKNLVAAQSSKDYFLLDDGTIISENDIYEGDSFFECDAEIEKMSKRYFNTVDPVDLCNKYGADTFRMYEMFLGPVEQSKPWDTKGIEGVHRFLKKLWRLFYTDINPTNNSGGQQTWNTQTPTDAEQKILQKTIKKIEQDTENFSYNTAVSAFMVCVNELTDAKCYKKEILEQLLILLSPYAPHIAEELWHLLGNEGFIIDASYPTLQEKYLIEATKEYPVSINGKMRSSINLPTEVTEAEAKEAVLATESITKWLDGKEPKKFIFVKGRMINVVV